MRKIPLFDVVMSGVDRNAISQKHLVNWHKSATKCGINYF